jgi:Peptidase family M28
LAERLFAQLAERTREADGSGVRRDSYGPGEAAAHDIVAAAAREFDLAVTRDAALNLYMSAAGGDPDAPGIIVGSHLDSVAHGGNYDGAAGVIAGLAALAGFRRIGKRPPRTVTVMAIRAEESVWFDAPYIGSRAALGRLEPALLDSVRRPDSGRTLGDHIAEWGGDLAALGLHRTCARRGLSRPEPAVRLCGAASAVANPDAPSFGLFDPGDGELSVDAVRNELHPVARLDGSQHRGVAGAEHHGHAVLHVEFLERAVLDGDLARRLIDLGDLAVDQVALCGARKRHQGCRASQQGGGNEDADFHAFSFALRYFTMTFPVMPASR